MSEIAPCQANGFIASQIADEKLLVGVAVDAIRREIPFYRSLDERALADTAGVIAVALRKVLTSWEEGRLPQRVDAEEFPRLGVISGSVLRPLPVVLRGWRVGVRAVHESVLERGDGLLSTGDVAGLSRIVLAWLELIADAVMEAYAQVGSGVEPPGGPAIRTGLILSLITGSYSSTDVLRRRAAIAGVILPEPALVLVGTATDHESPLAELMARFLTRLEVEADHRLELELDGRAVMVVPPVDGEKLREAVASASLRAAAVGAGDVGEVTAAYRTALRATHFLASLGGDLARLFPETETRLAALVAAELSGRSELRAIIDGLGAGDEGELVTTMLAYYETGSAESAAHRIGVHPQTVRYRLRGIRERTGLDPTVGWSRFVIELAVRVRAANERPAK